MKANLSKSFYTKLTLELLLSIATLFIIIVILSISNDNYNKNSLYNLNQNVGNVLTNTITNNIELTEQVSQTLLSSRELIDFISIDYVPKTDYSQYTNSIRNYISATANIDYRSDIRIYVSNNTIPMGMGIIYPLDKINANSTIRSFFQSSLHNSWFSGEDFIYDYNPYFFPTTDSFIYMEKVTDSIGNFLGLIVCSIPEKYFFSETTSENATIISTGHNRIVNYSEVNFSEEDIQYLETIENEYSEYKEALVYKQTFDFFPFDIYIATPKDNSHSIISIILICMICFFLFLAIIFFNNLKIVFYKIYDCINIMEQSISNNFELRIIEKGNDELTQVAKKINMLLEKISELLKLTVKKETAHREAQLIALQHQINPHFIYNTMEVFSSKMKLYRLYEESDALVSFANIFRYNVTNRGDLVPLHEELNQAENYINIQKLSFPNIRLETFVPDELSQLKILKFIFQPLIENSIIHGIEDRKKSLTIGIRTWRSSVNPNHIHFAIEDNGIGIPSEKLDLLNHSLKTRTPVNTLHTAKNSIGLYNINSRLKLHYGEDNHLTISSMEGSGTIISFYLVV